jgi:hypothetical protein
VSFKRLGVLNAEQSMLELTLNMRWTRQSHPRRARCDAELAGSLVAVDGSESHQHL